MVSCCRMIRLMLLPLLLFALSMACTGQTFQYSRGWTNGKRAIGGAHFHRTDDDSLQDFYEIQDGERKLEKCLLQLQRVLRNPLVLHGGAALSLNPNIPNGNANSNTNGNANGNSNNNNPYTNHHQSNELFEELNAVDPNDYGKH